MGLNGTFLRLVCIHLNELLLMPAIFYLKQISKHILGNASVPQCLRCPMKKLLVLTDCLLKYFFKYVKEKCVISA